MGASASVRTNGDDFASVECGAVLVELSKDGDSPACPDSWTWAVYYDGGLIEGTGEETSLATAVDEVVGALTAAVRDIAETRDWLRNFGAFGEEGR